MAKLYKEIKINEQFTFSPHKYDWKLHEYHKINASNKSEKRNTNPNVTYHLTLKKLCNFIINRYACNATSIKEIRELLENASLELTKELKELLEKSGLELAKEFKELP